MNKAPKVAFYIRNRFQAEHMRPLFNAINGAVWIAKNRRRLKECGIADHEPQTSSNFFIRQKLKRSFDYVIGHASVPGRGDLGACKLVMLQYGYAKEPYNFGEWREKADLILSYGEYANHRFQEHAPSRIIGVPQWDMWQTDEFHTACKAKYSETIDPLHKTVLYAPTWGELSSLDEWLDHILKLSETYNVLVKAHHNSAAENTVVSKQDIKNVFFCPDENLYELLVISDVMISDNSGAIFDAILCEKPVVLVSPSNIEEKFGKKIDHDSIEIRRRRELGTIVDSASNLPDVINRTLSEKRLVDEKLRTHLFETKGSVIQRFKEVLFSHL